jgi:hypothetical protein
MVSLDRIRLIYAQSVNPEYDIGACFADHFQEIEEVRAN